ncbi:hypothetical protein FKM82_005226 [Ascaphus truei]
MKPVPTNALELFSHELVNNRIGKETALVKDAASQHDPQSREGLYDSEAEKEPPLLHQEVSEMPSTVPNFTGNQTLPTRKKPPSLKQLNTARKRLRPQATPAVFERLVEPSASFTPSTEKVPSVKDFSAEIRAVKEPIPEFPLWINRRRHSGTIPQSPLQLSPYTSPPLVQHDPDSIKLSLPDINTSMQADEPYRTHFMDNDLNTGEKNPETTTSTIITTTVTTTEQSPVQCSVNFDDPEGYIDSTDYPPLPSHNYLECTYNITVYMGYGVELQVKSVNLSEGEQLSIRGVGDDGLVVLANETLLVEGQVIRSPTNSLSVYFKTFQDDAIGTFQLHYQIFMLSCRFPRRPDYGDVSVKDLHAGGKAHFDCYMGYELQGSRILTCLNASKPHWSSKDPVCSAPCGGKVQNATVGRVLSPNYPSNYSNNLFCAWTIDASGGQKLHLHFEKYILSDKDRLAVYSNGKILFDSVKTETVPFEGLISEGSCIRIEFSTDESKTAPGFNIRFEAFERGHCYEPYIQNGNFTTSDPTYSIGTVIEFSCDPGHSLEQGPAIIECINMRDPYWNDTEPLCRAMCGGELSTPAGVILSPNWPEPYTDGEDCIWRIHVGDDRRIFLDIQLEPDHYQCDPDMILWGAHTPDMPVGLSWSSDPPFCEKSEVDHYYSLNFGPILLVGTTIQYTCTRALCLKEALFSRATVEKLGPPIGHQDPPLSEESLACDNPGLPENGYQILYKRLYLPGEALTFMCYEGFELMGEVTIKCILGQPSQWSGHLPMCKATPDRFEHALQVAEAAAETSLEGGNMALAIFIPVVIISVLLGGAYIYITRCRYYSSLRLPLMYSHPYSQITVETEFDNPIYETGETREYEVSI